MVERRKNILFISYYFAPSNIVGAKRPSNLSYFLSNYGINFHVLTVKDKYHQGHDAQIKYGGKIYRTRMLPPYPVQKNSLIKKGFSRIWETIAFVDPYSGWIIPAVIKGISLIIKNKIDFIIVTGPPFSPFLIAYVLSLIFNKKLILDYRDPWFLYSGRSTKGLRYKLNMLIEKAVLKRANKIIFNTLNAKEAYLKSNLTKNISIKSFIVENAIMNGKDSDPILLEKHKKVILYAGNLYGKRKLNYLFEPLKKLYNNGLIQKDGLAIHVFGKIPSDDIDYLGKKNMYNLVIEHEKENIETIIRYMKSVDVLYLPQGDDVKYSIAYKFYDYLSAKKPILAVTSQDSATAEIMKEIDCGEVADIFDPDSIYKALYTILVEKKTYSFQGSEKYTWDNISKKYLELLNE